MTAEQVNKSFDLDTTEDVKNKIITANNKSSIPTVLKNIDDYENRVSFVEIFYNIFAKILAINPATIEITRIKDVDFTTIQSAYSYENLKEITQDEIDKLKKYVISSTSITFMINEFFLNIDQIKALLNALPELDPDKTPLESIDEVKQNYENLDISAILEYQYDEFYFATRMVKYRLNPDTKVIEKVEDEPIKIMRPTMLYVFKMRDLWIGAHNKGEYVDFIIFDKLTVFNYKRDDALKSTAGMCMRGTYGDDWSQVTEEGEEPAVVNLNQDIQDTIDMLLEESAYYEVKSDKLKNEYLDHKPMFMIDTKQMAQLMKTGNCKIEKIKKAA
jgi:hypothetical protein